MLLVVQLGPLVDRLENYMNLLATRQRLVTSNIANVDTPGYRTQDIDFQFEYLAAAGSSDTAKLAPNVVGVPGLPVKNDGNDVNLDREARLLAENGIRFNLASTLMRNQVRAVRSAIQEGRAGA